MTLGVKRRPDPRQRAPLCAALAYQTSEVNNEDIVEALGEVRDPASVAVLAATLRRGQS